MADAARVIDRFELTPAFTDADAAVLNARFAGVPAPAMLAQLLADLAGRIAIVSSFGAESAVLLHLVASIDPAVPVIFIDTAKMFAETLAYRDTLARRLGLADLRTLGPDPVRLAARDPLGERFAYDPDGCCDLRKVEPLARGLAGFDSWISGRKGFQASTRTALPRFEIDATDGGGRLKVNPLADWPRDRLDAYITAHDLPRHPLEAHGFPSIGCAPCTSPVRPGEDPRAGRWRGLDKVECGIHQPAGVVDLHPH